MATNTAYALTNVHFSKYSAKSLLSFQQGQVMKSLINSIGVGLSTIGAFLVWRYIAQLNFIDKNSY